MKLCAETIVPWGRSLGSGVDDLIGTGATHEVSQDIPIQEVRRIIDPVGRPRFSREIEGDGTVGEHVWVLNSSLNRSGRMFCALSEHGPRGARYCAAPVDREQTSSGAEIYRAIRPDGRGGEQGSIRWLPCREFRGIRAKRIEREQLLVVPRPDDKSSVGRNGRR